MTFDRIFVEGISKFIKVYSLEENVKLTGLIPYDDLRKLYAACDIFVLPSFGEGDSISLKEALASGKPLIGTNVGGILAQIKDGWNGFLVEPANEN